MNKKRVVTVTLEIEYDDSRWAGFTDPVGDKAVETVLSDLAEISKREKQVSGEGVPQERLLYGISSVKREACAPGFLVEILEQMAEQARIQALNRGKSSAAFEGCALTQAAQHLRNRLAAIPKIENLVQPSKLRLEALALIEALDRTEAFDSAEVQECLKALREACWT